MVGRTRSRKGAGHGRRFEKEKFLCFSLASLVVCTYTLHGKREKKERNREKEKQVKRKEQTIGSDKTDSYADWERWTVHTSKYLER